MTTNFANLSAFKASRKLGEHSNNLGSAFERLSTGLRINRAADDAAGLAVAADLKTDTRVYSQAVRNVNDAISSLNVADGGLSELESILTRVKELANQSANGVYSLTQRTALDKEADQLVKEFNRITATTKFNGNSLLSAGQSSTRIQMGYGTDASFAYTMAEELDRVVNSGTFQSVINAGSTLSNVSGSYDFNADGLTDILGTTNGVGQAQVGINNGNGTFSTINATPSGNPLRDATAADFDGNGTLDLLLTDNANNSFFYSGNGNGTFAAAVSSATGAGGSNISAADFNGDGVLDLLSSSGTSVMVNIGRGDGTFNTSQTAVNLGVTVSSLEVGDFDGDGRPDFAASNTANSSVQIYTNSGSATFSNTATLTAAAVGSNLRIGDINYDGMDDIVAISSGVAYTAQAAGGGTFSSLQSTGIAASTGNTTSLADMNGDGLLDLLTTDGSTSVMYYAGNADGTFSTAAAGTSSTAIIASNVVAGDYNGDGAMDIFTCRNFPTVANRVQLSNTSTVCTLPRLYLLDQEGARSALSVADTALDRVRKERGKIGANLSRLDSAMANIESVRLNSAAALSRITDADIAEETSKMVKLQVLENATQAVEAQANLTAQTVLDLLKF